MNGSFASGSVRVIAMTLFFIMSGCSTVDKIDGPGGGDTTTAGGATASITASAAASAVSVARGATVTVPIVVTRSGTTAEAIMLATPQLPAGVTASFNPASIAVGASSSVLTLAAGNNAALATGNVIVRATSGTLTSDATIALTVSNSVGNTGNTMLDMRACAYANGIFAVQDGATAAWTRVTSPDGIYRFNVIAQKVGLMYRDLGGQEEAVRIVYLTQAELSSMPLDQLCTVAEEQMPARQLRATIASSIKSEESFISTIGNSPIALPSGNLWTFYQIPRGTQDWVSMLVNRDSATTALIIRRDINFDAYPDGALITPALRFPQEATAITSVSSSYPGHTTSSHFNSGAFVGVGASCTIGMLAPPFPINSNSFAYYYLYGAMAARMRAHQISNPDMVGVQLPLAALLFDGLNPTVPISRIGTVPQSALTGNDVLGTMAWEIEGTMVGFLAAGPGTSRYVSETSRNSMQQSVTMPAFMPEIAPTNVAAPSYRRLRFQFNVPADVNQAVLVRYGSNGILSIRMTIAYLGGRTVDITTPDFTSLPGWTSSMAPRGTLVYEITGESETHTGKCSVGRTAVSSRYGLI